MRTRSGAVERRAAVLAHSVAKRTREIGIRLALGQGPAEVRGLVMRDGLRMVSLALLLGLVTSGAVSRAASELIFEVQPLDPLAYVATCALFAVVSAAAIGIPARRATEVDPLTALRE